MLTALLPPQVDRTFRGHRIALWLLGALLLMKGAIGFGTIFNGEAAAMHADGIPLDTFTPAGRQAFISLFAAWGWSQVVLNAFGALLLFRYRTLVPLMFLLLLLEHLVRKLIFVVLPQPRLGTPPGVFVNLALVGVMLLGLALSLWNQGRQGSSAEGPTA